jgi:hypothetical protein
MTTLSEYMERMNQVLQNNGITFLLFFNLLNIIKNAIFILFAINEGTPPSRDSEGQQHPEADDANLNPRFPRPDVLAQVIERTQQLLGGSTASALSVCHLSNFLCSYALCFFSFAILINLKMLCFLVDGVLLCFAAPPPPPPRNVNTFITIAFFCGFSFFITMFLEFNLPVHNLYKCDF